ncbi:MAG: T9SS type A sorting domain-containing protein [Bacteroidales bacterium]|nr:T9SS type A sorting domain-containing protein [Bacteroidales bacterium]
MNKFIITLAVIFVTLSTFGQYENIVISNIYGPNEPSISMNPRNPDLLLAGANTNSYYYSIDGGHNWTRGTLTSAENGVWGDPCIIVDTAGAFYFLHLSNPASGNWIDRIVSQKYDILANEWTTDSYMGLNGTKAQDKEWAVVDSASNTIYVTWTQFDEYGTSAPDKFSNILFSKSTDAGTTWTPAMQINKVSGDCVDSDNTTEGAVPAVGPEGQVYVAWSGPAGIVFDRSLDGGETWLEEDIFISDQPGGWDYNVPGIMRCNGLPVTCCDISAASTNKGTIYVNWTDQRNGTQNPDVWLAKSTDGGDTWTPPLRVNDDDTDKAQFFSWMAIDQANGDIYIVYYDRRNYDNESTDVYLARSTDGGETFSNFKISESPFIPYSSIFFGDYTNIVAYNGRVRPIWTRLENGNLSVLTAIIDQIVDEPEIAEELIKAPIHLDINYPNPFKASTYISYKLREPAVISLSVYDVYGRKIASLISNQPVNAGKYTEIFHATDYNLSPGVYYFALSTNQTVKKQKMLLVE